MPILAWRNDVDGFAFRNSWFLDRIETTGLTGIAQAAVSSAVGALVPVVPDPLVLTAAMIAANLAIQGISPTIEMGLCGGMTYASLDYWLARTPLPRGSHANDQPTRTMPVGGILRDLIWGRLVHSLVQGQALSRTLEWSLLLNQVPAPFGGAGALFSRTLSEWTKVKSSIDAGMPCPIGLVYTGRDVWDQHQILVYGYEDFGNGFGSMYVYDCNSPHQFGDTNHSTVTLDLRGPSLTAVTPSDKTSGTLAGFFCTSYFPLPLPAWLATSFGRFLSWAGDPSFYATAYGARMPIADATELGALGGISSDVRPVVGATSPTTTTRPRDNALLRERSSAPIFLYQGGAPFQLPDPTWIDRFGGAGAVRLVPDGTLAAFVGPPADNTLLREWSAPEVFHIMSGQRRWVPNPAALARFGGFPSVRIVPDGALASIPQGPPAVALPDSPQVFNADFYLSFYGDLAAAFGNDRAAARDHWLEFGIGEGRRGSREFDVRFYLNLYADVANAFGTDYAAAIDHWLNQGLPNEGRRGSREFDVRFYVNCYADLTAAFGTNYSSALDHWILQGLPNEGRAGASEVDVRDYLGRYGDLQAAFGSNYQAALDHWILQGLPNEGRSASPIFDPRYYLATYPDLRAAFGAAGYSAALDHWLFYGINEMRSGAP